VESSIPFRSAMVRAKATRGTPSFFQLAAEYGSGVVSPCVVAEKNSEVIRSAHAKAP